MIENTICLEGTLLADGKLIPDEKPALPAGRVRIALQAIGDTVDPAPDLIAVLHGIRTAQQARGHAPRTREEIDADIAAMRSEDDERLQGIERLHEECERSRKSDSIPEPS